MMKIRTAPLCSLLTIALVVMTGCALAQNRAESLQALDQGAYRELRISSITSAHLDFEYSVTSVAGEPVAKVKGVAEAVQRQDEESLDDELEQAHPARDFVYQAGSCRIAIRVSMDEPRIARIIEEGCENMRLHENAFQSGLLRPKP